MRMKRSIIASALLLCLLLTCCGQANVRGNGNEALKQTQENFTAKNVDTPAATTWKARRARINTISPGVIVTPLAYDEFAAAGEGYQQMIDASAAERTGTSDEIAEAGAFLLGEHAGFITGTDLLIDGGVIASIRTGQYKLHG